MCSAHAAVRHLLGGLLAEKQVVTVVDMEAGLEHLSRGTGRHVETLLVVMEPYYKALETARRCAELGRELGIPQVLAVANKLRGEEDQAAVRHYAVAHGLGLAGEVPFDADISQADQSGTAPELRSGSAAARAIDSLTTALNLREAMSCSGLRSTVPQGERAEIP
jgi:CO dehydrogenase maturation factor